MSYRVLKLYEPDSDDSSSDGYDGHYHASMGIANDYTGRDDDSDKFSLSSDLMEIISDDEEEDPMTNIKDVKKYNRINLRVNAGKRLGIDSQDTSDDDGDHYNLDKDYSIAHRIKVSGDIEEHDIGSDDEYVPAAPKNFPKRITRNDKEFDALLPTGSPNEKTVGGAGSGADPFKNTKPETPKSRKLTRHDLDNQSSSSNRNESQTIVRNAIANAKKATGSVRKAATEQAPSKGVVISEKGAEEKEFVPVKSKKNLNAQVKAIEKADKSKEKADKAKEKADKAIENKRNEIASIEQEMKNADITKKQLTKLKGKLTRANKRLKNLTEKKSS
jgi:hypothetical protein